MGNIPAGYTVIDDETVHHGDAHQSRTCLLSDTDKTILDVALTAGFTDPAAVLQLLLANLSVCRPQQYRKLSQQRRQRCRLNRIPYQPKK